MFGEIKLGVVVNLLMNLMGMLSVGRGAVIDILCMVF